MNLTSRTSFILKTILILSPAFNSVSAYSQTREHSSPKAQAYLSSLPAGTHVEVSTYLDQFLSDIVKRANHQKISLTEYVGFSGAGYAGNQFKSDFAQLAEQYSNQKGVVSAQILGGSVDGFGSGYNLIPSNNTIVGGMVADQVVAYHVEGQQKGWGDVISPRNEALYLVPTYSDAQGNQTWELKPRKESASETVQVLTRGSKFRGVESTRLVAFEGGEQALKEMIEFVLEKKSIESTSNIKSELVLVVGYDAGKAAKDKGARAATQMAMILRDHPEMSSRTLDVKIVPAGNVSQSFTVESFFQSSFGKSSRFQESNFRAYAAREQARIEAIRLTEGQGAAPEVVKQLEAKVQQAEANMRKAQALLSTDSVLESTATEVKERAIGERAYFESILRQASHPAHDHPGSYKAYSALSERAHSLELISAKVADQITEVKLTEKLTRILAIRKARATRESRQGDIDAATKAARDAMKE